MAEPLKDVGGMSDREIVNTRLFAAPRDMLFRAFKERERLARWWGPKGFRTTIHEFDFRPGATWRITMHGPDGAAYENEYVLLEADEPARIVISHPDPEHNFRLVITLASEGKKTRLTWRMHFESAQHCEQVKPFVTEANEQNLNRIEAELETLKKAEPEPNN